MRSTIPMRARRPAAAAAVIALVALAAARPSALKVGGGFIAMLGRDTVAAESYVIEDTVQTGVSMVRNQRGVVTRYYTLTLDAKGNLAKYEMASYLPGSEPPNGRPLVHTIWTPMGDAIHEVVHLDKEYTLHLVTPPTTLPYMDLGFGMWQVLTRRLAKSARDSLAIPMFFVNDTTHYTTVLVRKGADSVILTSIYGTGRARIDASGMILGYAAPGSTQQVVVTPERSVDVRALAAMFAQRPPIGVFSPADTVRATIGAAHLSVAYSRPSMRGRTIFGNVVPWGVWWRTGANAATTFITDKDLVIAGAQVPAGEYTLFTIPTPTAWTLIISKQTKEWGTDYDPKMDLARVPMTVMALAAPVEMVTFAIQPSGAGGTMSVSWERTSASVPIRVK